MCQSKSLGGKRCAIHHHGTQAAVQTTVVRTGINVEEVKGVFTALNKEGKNLTAPERAEFEAYLAKERFLTEIDQTIPEKEKKMILNKLDKAAVENTPSGGTFHAWKNLMGETVRKYSKKAKMVIAAVGIGAMVSVTAGCATGTDAPNSNTATASSVVLGDVIAGDPITDAYGTYLSTKINPDDEALKFNKAIVDNSAYDLGFDEAQITSAQKYAAEFVASQGADGAGLDDQASFDKWLGEAKTKYLTGNDQIMAEMTAKNNNGGNTPLVYNNSQGYQFARDGKPRISNEKIAINKIAGYQDSDGKFLTVSGQSKIDYRVPEANIVKWYLSSHTDVTEEQLLTKYPQLKDGKEETLAVTFDWQYYLIPDGQGWKISGMNNSYTSHLNNMDMQ